MSTKTNFKRVALVAVASLGLGVLTSIAPANAAAGDILLDQTSGSTGVCSVKQSGAYVSTTADQTGVGLTAPLSVTVALGGELIVDVDTSDENTLLNNGTLTVAGSGYNPNFNYGVWDEIDDTALTLAAVAVGTNTLTTYTDDPFSSGVPTGAAATGKLSITVVATCAGSGWSAKYSNIQVSDAFDDTPSSTAGDVLTYEAGADAYINIEAKNQYDAFMNAATVWVVTATGAKVKIGTTGIDASTASGGTLSATTATADGEDKSIRVTPTDAAAGGTAVVTITINDVAVATRTITFLPEATTIVPIAVGTGPVDGEGYVLYGLKSASGVMVPGNVTAVGTTLTSRVPSFTDIKDATIFKEPGGATTINGTTATAWFGSTVAGVAKFSCNAAGGSGSAVVTMTHTNSVTGADITLPVTLTCAGGLATYAISMDKASYKVGEVATLTITAKDSSGNAVNDFTAFDDDTHIVTPGGGSLVKAVADTDAFAAGVKTYQIQMTTAGAFNVVVNLPGSTTKSATAAYTVTSGGTSLEDVLKAIVSLIASINKQIAALQKALLKKK
jgi:hypothetical protein